MNYATLVFSILLLFVFVSTDAREKNCRGLVFSSCQDKARKNFEKAKCILSHIKKSKKECQEKLAPLKRRVQARINKKSKGVKEAKRAKQKGQNMSFFLRACKIELQSFCKKTKPGQGRLLECIKTSPRPLSPTCASAISST